MIKQKKNREKVVTVWFRLDTVFDTYRIFAKNNGVNETVVSLNRQKYLYRFDSLIKYLTLLRSRTTITSIISGTFADIAGFFGFCE